MVDAIGREEAALAPTALIIAIEEGLARVEAGVEERVGHGEVVSLVMLIGELRWVGLEALVEVVGGNSPHQLELGRVNGCGERIGDIHRRRAWAMVEVSPLKPLTWYWGLTTTLI
jgi:hypothetical protein